DVLTRFVQMTGDIQVTVVTEDDKTLLSMFEASELDIVIGPFHVEPWKSKGVVTKPLIGDPIIAVARYDHPIFQHDNIDQEILHLYPWAIPKTQGSIKREREGIVLPSPKVVADNYDLLRRISIRLDTLCGGPRAIFKKDIESKVLREIDADLGIFWQSTLLARPESLETPLVNRLVTLCEDVAKGIQRDSHHLHN
ncbi:MAG: LysR substrate-binding domain-containing protein, partial [Henriciella sp.]